jgi:hypothetical protein
MMASNEQATQANNGSVATAPAEDSQVPPSADAGADTRVFTITVLGRTLEHLGVQMYKRREPAIAELVANCWDAGAKSVSISVPKPEDHKSGLGCIIIEDDGEGMTPDHVQDQYLVVGRNRRQEAPIGPAGRPVMGRKGIGKLAGFGVADKMTVITWRAGRSTELCLDVGVLKSSPGQSQSVRIVGALAGLPDFAKTASGTRLVLKNLKHASALDVDHLRESLARRFTRVVRGQMVIRVNGEPLGEPALDIETSRPASGGYETARLASGDKVNFRYAFTEKPIRSTQMRGFAVYVRGKVAQAPPFFFNAEGKARGQLGTRYLSGEIEADFLDAGTDDNSDLISTDRQEIDWESDAARELREWGEKLTRDALNGWAGRKGEQFDEWILEHQALSDRICGLDSASEKQVRKFLKILAEADAEKEKALELADSLVQAYEYQHFHSFIDEIEAASADPEQLHALLGQLQKWKVLESRALLEIIKGRLGIVAKFHDFVISDAPETASYKSKDNMHDLLGRYPWILNPEWQVLSEETTISRQLQEWGDADAKEDRERYDFLALSGEQRLVIIEIKRSGHAVTLDELQRLERYKSKLSKARKGIYMVLICGGTYDIDADILDQWKNRKDGELRTWQDIHEKTRQYYEHYRAVLERDVSHRDFTNKATEVAETRKILAGGTVHRSPKERAKGLGPQDVDHGGA